MGITAWTGVDADSPLSEKGHFAQPNISMLGAHTRAHKHVHVLDGDEVARCEEEGSARDCSALKSTEFSLWWLQEGVQRVFVAHIDWVEQKLWDQRVVGR
jgi:hypothetical protein